uniref:Uncharacterized protein n=1 Tax=Moniliophthora roreri TaxID=221103 RepID=A0A0W0FLY3_MONRR
MVRILPWFLPLFCPSDI